MAITVQPPLGPRGHRAFFAECEKAFELSAAMLLELEHVTGTGIGTLAQRVLTGAFRAADVRETIRLGLLGAGTSPEEAAALVAVYVDGRPVYETYGLAVDILNRALFGQPKSGVSDPLLKSASPEKTNV